MAHEHPPLLARPLLIGVDEMPDAVATPFVLPSGTVTFLLTDVEGSTLAWQRHPDAMAGVIARHYEILDAAISRWEGVRPVEQGEGDSVVGGPDHGKDSRSPLFGEARHVKTLRACG